MKRIVFTGGGSAGHVVPNLALFPALREFDLSYIGTDGIEKELLAREGIPYYEIRCPKLIRSLTPRNLGIPNALRRAVAEARRGLELIRPDLVFSKGGYVALPVVCAASRMKIPVLSHESDLSPGLTTRLCAKKSKRVLTAFPETADRFRNGKYVGNPIRAALFSANRASARQKYGIDSDRPVLLVFGGGSGAAAINTAVRAHIAELCRSYTVLHLCGKGNVVRTNMPHYLQREYESDMASAYAASDLVLSRAGANTVFELLALRKRAVLVPLEHGSRGDQVENAAYFTKKGLCRTLREDALDRLPEAVADALADSSLSEALSHYAAPAANAAILTEIKAALA